MPIEKEAKKVVFKLNGDGANRPDGFTWKFYQRCCSIVRADIVEVVKCFFVGCTLPKSIPTLI